MVYSMCLLAHQDMINGRSRVIQVIMNITWVTITGPSKKSLNDRFSFKVKAPLLRGFYFNLTIGKTHLKINNLHERIPAKSLHNPLIFTIFVVDDKG